MNEAIWYQNYYRLRKKVLALTNKYWIEDSNGKTLAFSKQKMFKLKEDIRIYKDEKMKEEIFRIKQTQIIDIWGKFAVIDSRTNEILGYIKRKVGLSTFAWDAWSIYDKNNALVGEIEEKKGRGLVRKYAPGGGLVPEKMTLYLNGQPVANINQKFKIIGDIWEVNVLNMPQNFDRRVLLGGALLMAMIERQHKKSPVSPFL